MSGGHAAAPVAAIFDTTIPSVRRIHNLIKDKQEIELMLVTGESLQGTLQWIDDHCLGVEGIGAEKGSAMVVWLSAVVFVKYRR